MLQALSLWVLLEHVLPLPLQVLFFYMMASAGIADGSVAIAGVDIEDVAIVVADAVDIVGDDIAGVAIAGVTIEKMLFKMLLL